MKSNNMPVLEKHLVSEKVFPEFEGPYILKPRFGGSSIGVEVVDDYKTAITIVSNSDLYIQGATIEINTIPGSHALYLWDSKGFSKFELMNDMISEAKNSLSSWSTEGSDGTALKSAKDIKSKLG